MDIGSASARKLHELNPFCKGDRDTTHLPAPISCLKTCNT